MPRSWEASARKLPLLPGSLQALSIMLSKHNLGEGVVDLFGVQQRRGAPLEGTHG